MLNPYLTKDDLQRLAKYSYHSSPGTLLDDFLNRYWWTPLSDFVPRTVHPNVLTLIALISSVALGFFPLALATENGSRKASPYVYFLSALGYFIYQTLDAIDGKQARRTGLSSPIGQLMDHGCDSLTTFFSVFTVANLVSLTSGASIALLLTTISFELLYYTWYEYNFGIFRSCTGKYTGVTEGQWAIIILALANMFPIDWHSPLSTNLALGDPIARYFDTITLHLTLGQLLFWPSTLLMVFLNVTDVCELLTHKRIEDENRAKTEWIQLAFHLWVNATLLLTGSYDRHPILVTCMISFAGSLLTWRLILSSVAKSALRPIELSSVPFYAVSLLISAGAFSTYPVIETLLLYMGASWSFIALMIFCVVNMYTIKSYLGKPIFVVPHVASAASPKRGDLIKESARDCTPCTTAHVD